VAETMNKAELIAAFNARKQQEILRTNMQNKPQTIPIKHELERDL